MVTINQAQNNLIQYLKPVGTKFNVPVEPFPDKQEVRKRVWQRQIILVAFKDKLFIPPSENQKYAIGCVPVTQKVTFQFDILVYVRNLRDDTSGAHCICDEITAQITGKKMGNLCGGMYVTNIGFDNVSDANFWLYIVSVEGNCKESNGNCYQCNEDGIC